MIIFFLWFLSEGGRKKIARWKKLKKKTGEKLFGFLFFNFHFFPLKEREIIKIIFVFFLELSSFYLVQININVYGT